MKKITCAFLAIVMCMALAVPALAASVASGTVYSATVQNYTVAVTASANNTIILNPYQVALKPSEIVTGGRGDDISPAVFAPTLVLKSTSNVPLKMTLTATGAIPENSNAAFSATPIVDGEKNRKVFLYLAIDNVGPKDSDNEGPQITDSLTAANVPAYDASKVWSTSNTRGTQAVFKAGDVKMTDVCVIAVPEANKGSYVAINIGGECAKSPTVGWTAADKVSISLAYTFQADSNSTASGS